MTSNSGGDEKRLTAREVIFKKGGQMRSFCQLPVSVPAAPRAPPAALISPAVYNERVSLDRNRAVIRRADIKAKLASRKLTETC